MGAKISFIKNSACLLACLQFRLRVEQLFNPLVSENHSKVYGIWLDKQLLVWIMLTVVFQLKIVLKTKKLFIISFFIAN